MEYLLNAVHIVQVSPAESTNVVIVVCGTEIEDNVCESDESSNVSQDFFDGWMYDTHLPPPTAPAPIQYHNHIAFTKKKRNSH